MRSALGTLSSTDRPAVADSRGLSIGKGFSGPRWAAGIVYLSTRTVDIINLVSVESRLPIGLYDLDHVKGDITFRAGRAGETYKGIGKYDLNLEDLAVFSDAEGPHGSPTSDSERTMVTLSTTHVAAIFISFGGPDGLQESCDRMAALFAKYAQGHDITAEIVQ